MILNQFCIDGRVALVTGAASGMGQAIAVALAQAGAHIAAVGHSRGLEETVRQVEANNRRCLAVTADLTSIEPIPRLINETMRHFERLDILVNVAGMIRRAPALEFTEKDWDDVLNLNLKTVFFLSQAAARVMKRNHKGKIINIASMLSFQGGILVPSYAASKGGVASLTKSLANEWAQYGINVNAIAPGYIDTILTAPIKNDPIRNSSILERIPAGRWGVPADVQGAAVFLATDASNYLQGSILNIDGGWLAR